MHDNLLRRLANTRAGLYFRHAFGVRAPEYIPNFTEVVSDLFVWRCDDIWETYFDLTHIAGILNPEMRLNYSVSLVIFSSDGIEIGRHTQTVMFAESYLVRINDLPGAANGHGTFAVLHMAPLSAVFGPERTCLTERGYVSYRRKLDSSPLRSYVHGNLYGIGGNPTTRQFRTLTLSIRQTHEYQPQVRLDDCERCEIALVNYSPRRLNVEALALRGGKSEQRLNISLNPRGSVVIDSSTLPLERIALRAKLPLPRPLLFKHYASHFDVFHG